MSEFDEEDRNYSEYWDDERITDIPNPLEKLRKKKDLTKNDRENMDALIRVGIKKDMIMNLIPHQKLESASMYYEAQTITQIQH